MSIRIVVGAILLLGTIGAADTLEIIRQIPHSGYSEGLTFEKGFLWHALPDSIVKIDPKDGTVLEKYDPATEYSESIVWFQNALWNLSYHDNGIYKGNLTKDKKLEFTRAGSVPEKHGWGIAYTGKEFVVTGNYSKKLYFLDPVSLQLKRTIEVPAKDLEDLAWDGERIWTSSYTEYKGQIFSVNPKDGTIDGFYSLPEPDKCPVIDGIAFDGKGLWITGKHCTSIYYAKVPPRRAISGK